MYVIILINYKTPFVLNGQPVTVDIALGEGVVLNTNFLWPFLQTIKASIMTKNNSLVIVFLG